MHWKYQNQPNMDNFNTLKEANETYSQNQMETYQTAKDQKFDKHLAENGKSSKYFFRYQTTLRNVSIESIRMESNTDSENPQHIREQFNTYWSSIMGDNGYTRIYAYLHV